MKFSISNAEDNYGAYIFIHILIYLFTFLNLIPTPWIFSSVSMSLIFTPTALNPVPNYFPLNVLFWESCLVAGWVHYSCLQKTWILIWFHLSWEGRLKAHTLWLFTEQVSERGVIQESQSCVQSYQLCLDFCPNSFPSHENRKSKIPALSLLLHSALRNTLACSESVSPLPQGAAVAAESPSPEVGSPHMEHVFFMIKKHRLSAAWSAMGCPRFSDPSSKSSSTACSQTYRVYGCE